MPTIERVPVAKQDPPVRMYLSGGCTALEYRVGQDELLEDEVPGQLWYIFGMLELSCGGDQLTLSFQDADGDPVFELPATSASFFARVQCLSCRSRDRAADR